VTKTIKKLGDKSQRIFLEKLKHIWP